jgi:hypothetical protein
MTQSIKRRQFIALRGGTAAAWAIAARAQPRPVLSRFLLPLMQYLTQAFFESAAPILN